MILLSNYVVFDYAYLLELYTTVKANIGTIVTVALFVLLTVLSIYTVIRVIRSFI